jgi:NADH/NAD ratio-sensing transcriptional regulator Rex
MASENRKWGYPKQEYKTLKDLARILSLFNDFHTEEIGASEIAQALGVHSSKVRKAS